MLETKTRRTLPATTLRGVNVRNRAGERLGALEDVVIDLPTGRVAYAVVSFGGVLTIGEKLFAIPWSALELDEQHHEIVLDLPRDRLETAPGFDKDHWPDMADLEWGRSIYSYYGQKPA
jgi:sporulation protein YlmC with PRC-barrel domain